MKRCAICNGGIVGRRDSATLCGERDCLLAYHRLKKREARRRMAGRQPHPPRCIVCVRPIVNRQAHAITCSYDCEQKRRIMRQRVYNANWRAKQKGKPCTV